MVEEVNRPTVVVFGASSQIGLFVLPRLVASGCRVLAVSREPRPNGYPEFEAVRWVRAAALATAGEAATGLLSAGPLGLVLEQLDLLPKLRRAVVFSTTSVFSKLNSPAAGERRQMQAITGKERQLQQACHDRGIRLCLLRPTLVYGCGLDENVSRLARWMQAHRWIPIAGRAAGLRQPVHADDLAEAAVQALQRVMGLPPELCLSGGSTLTYREMLDRIASGIGVQPRLIALPAPLLAGLVRVAAWLPGLRGISPAMVQRQNQDLVFDDAAARGLLQYAPRPFRPRPEDFRRPDADQLRALARAEQRNEAEDKNVKI